MFSLGFGPSDASNSLAQESNHERVLALDLLCIDGEELGDSVGHNLLKLGAGDGIRAGAGPAPDLP